MGGASCGVISAPMINGSDCSRAAACAGPRRPTCCDRSPPAPHNPAPPPAPLTRTHARRLREKKSWSCSAVRHTSRVKYSEGGQSECRKACSRRCTSARRRAISSACSPDQYCSRPAMNTWCSSCRNVRRARRRPSRNVDGAPAVMLRHVQRNREGQAAQLQRQTQTLGQRKSTSVLR